MASSGNGEGCLGWSGLAGVGWGALSCWRTKIFIGRCAGGDASDPSLSLLVADLEYVTTEHAAHPQYSDGFIEAALPASPTLVAVSPPHFGLLMAVKRR